MVIASGVKDNNRLRNVDDIHGNKILIETRPLIILSILQRLASALRYTRDLTYLFVPVYRDPKHYRPLQPATAFSRGDISSYVLFCAQSLKYIFSLRNTDICVIKSRYSESLFCHVMTFCRMYFSARSR